MPQAPPPFLREQVHLVKYTGMHILTCREAANEGAPLTPTWHHIFTQSVRQFAGYADVAILMHGVMCLHGNFAIHNSQYFHDNSINLPMNDTVWSFHENIILELWRQNINSLSNSKASLGSVFRPSCNCITRQQNLSKTRGKAMKQSNLELQKTFQTTIQIC